MIVDVHTHWYPREYVKEAEDLGTDSTTDRSWLGYKTGLGKIDPMGRSIDDCLAEMDAGGIDISVLSLSIPNVYFPDSAKSHYLAQLTNDAFAEVCRQYPRRFMALASLPWEFPELAIEEMHRAIEKLGLAGLVVGGNIRGKQLNAPQFQPIFEEADHLNLAILIHPMIPVAVETWNEYGMAASIGYLFDTTTAFTRLVFSGLFERCPNLKIIMPHMGGIVPFAMERIDNATRSRPDNARNLKQSASEHFKRHYYDSANFHVPAMKCGYENFGASHIVYGTDFPFRPGGANKSTTTIRAMGLSDEETEMIFSGNALRILRH